MNAKMSQITPIMVEEIQIPWKHGHNFHLYSRVDVILESMGFGKNSQASKFIKNSTSIVFYCTDLYIDVGKNRMFKNINY